jgi:hypothetical protein
VMGQLLELPLVFGRKLSESAKIIYHSRRRRGQVFSIKKARRAPKGRPRSAELGLVDIST